MLSTIEAGAGLQGAGFLPERVTAHGAVRVPEGAVLANKMIVRANLSTVNILCLTTVAAYPLRHVPHFLLVVLVELATENDIPYDRDSWR